MTQFVTRNVGDVVAEILMSRTAFNGSFLVVEGDTDSKFFQRRIAKSHCQIVIAGGKSTVCGAVVQATHIGQTGILGVIDDDYDSICGTPIPSAHIIRLDARDVESLLLRSGALELMIGEMGDNAKIASFEATEKITVREALVVRSLIFGKLRLLNCQRGWSFQFDSLSPARFSDENSWTIDEQAIVAFVSGRLAIPVPDLMQMLAAIPVADPFVLLHGRDTAKILAIGLKRRLGNQSSGIDQLCKMLRLAFDDQMAAASLVFQQIKNWESNNARYRVLM